MLTRQTGNSKGTRPLTSETIKQEGRLQEEETLRSEKRTRKPFSPLTPHTPPAAILAEKSRARCCMLMESLGEQSARNKPHTHGQQLRTGLFSSHSCLLGHCPRGLSITGLSSHQRRSCCQVAPTLPLATTFHCIPGRGEDYKGSSTGMCQGTVNKLTMQVPFTGHAHGF